jgi:pilus assembly protein CpaC
LPVLSQIPILGFLFGTHSELATDTEDVVFIVPSVLDAVSMDSRARIKEALEAYDEYTGELDKLHLRPNHEIPEPKKPTGGGVVLEPEGK